MLPIRIMVVGGTIDAQDYDETEGKVKSFGEPAIESILKTGGVRIPYKRAKIPFEDDGEIVVLDQIDSLDMTEDDRIKILLFCLLDDKERILITHGTDTMVQTGLLLKKHVQGKTIVLVGAMRPHRFTQSDASFNVGGALIACQTLPQGVYVVMQGQVFEVENVHKVKEAGDAYFQGEGTESSDDQLRCQADTAQRRIEKLLARGLWRKKHIELMSISVPLDAKVPMSSSEVKGIAVKEAYYTAGYDEVSREQYLGAVNHTDTYVIDGKEFGNKKDILLRTGNPIIDLKPEALQIVQQITENDAVIFFVEKLKKKRREQVLSKTGVGIKYRQSASVFGGEIIHTKKSIFKPLWDMFPKE